MARIPRVLALLMPFGCAIVWAHLLWPFTSWENGVVWFSSATLALAALVTAYAGWRPSARVSIVVAGVLCAIQAILIALTLAGVRVVDYDLFPSRAQAVIVGIALVLCIVGLYLGKMWARWLGFALGLVGAVSGTMNGVRWWQVTNAPDPRYWAWSMDNYLTAWLMWVSAIGGALVAINLAAPAVRSAFAARANDTLSSSSHGVVRWLRATLIAAFGAVPMLLVYAWQQPIVHQTQATAVALAAALAVAAVLAVRGKSIGAILLVLAGAGLLAETVLTVLWATPEGREVAGYYVVFWAPAALLALATGVRLAVPIWNALR